MLGLALVSLLGWWWAMGKVQDLRLELRMVKAKAEELEQGNWLARDSRLAMAHSLENLKAKDLGKDWEQKKHSDWDSVQPLELESQTDLDLLSDLAKESARQEREKANWKVQG